jgi:hypothetical protein
MVDEAVAILEIMRSVGVLDFVMERVKNQDQAVEMCKIDFNKLMRVYAEGA